MQQENPIPEHDVTCVPSAVPKGSSWLSQERENWGKCEWERKGAWHDPS